MGDEDTDAGSDLLTRIQNHYGELRRSERIVADYLRAHADERLNASITQFARTLGVSEATISRVSRALGYEGYPNMKLSLAEGASRANRYANLPSGLEETDPPITLSEKLSATLASSLRETHRMLDADRIENAVEAIAGADRTIFVGVGGAASICDEAVHMFLKAGIDAASYRDGYTQIVAASTMTPARTLVGISHSGRTKTVAAALKHARDLGSKTIAITSDPQSPVAKAAAIVLTTSHHTSPPIPLYGDFLEGRICQLFLIDLIYLRLLFRSGEMARNNLSTTGRALARYYEQDTGKAES